MGVDEAGQQGGVAQVDLDGAGGGGEAGAHGLDLAALDDYHAALDRGVALAVEQARGLEDGGLRRGRGLGRGDGGAGGGGEDDHGEDATLHQGLRSWRLGPREGRYPTPARCDRPWT